MPIHIWEVTPNGANVRKNRFLSLVCASTPPEAEALLKTAKPYLLPTAGLHPVAGGIIFRK